MAEDKKEIGKTSLPKGSQAQSVLVDQIKRENMRIEQIVEQMDLDYQVALAFRVLSANCNQAEITFNVEAPENADGATVERLETLSKKISELWEQTRKSMMESIKYGRVAYEKIWDYDERRNLSFIRRLDDLPFRKTKLKLHPKDSEQPGAFQGIELRAGGEELIFYESKAWWLAFEPTALEPHGRSMYAGAPYQVWKDRKASREMRSKFIRKFALGGATVHGPSTVVDEETGEHVDARELTAAAYHDLQEGGLLFFDNARDENGNYIWDFNDQGISQKSEGPLSALMGSMDQEQLLAFGIPPKTVIEGDAVGSFALVSQQMLILYSVVEDILDQQLKSFQKYVVNKQVQRNVRVHKDEQLIVSAYPRLTDRPDDLSVELVKAWLLSPQLSPVVLSGAVDVSAVLEAVGIPLSDQAGDRITEMIRKQAEIQQRLETAPTAQPQPEQPEPVQMQNHQGQNGNGPPVLPFPKRMA